MKGPKVLKSKEEKYRDALFDVESTISHFILAKSLHRTYSLTDIFSGIQSLEQESDNTLYELLEKIRNTIY